MDSRQRRNREADLPASAATSRALVLGFVIAGMLGLAAGIAWLGWNWIN